MKTIYDAAVEFQEIKKQEYNIVLGYKNRSSNISLRFFDDNFFHLCGLQYLKDVAALNDISNSSKALNLVLNKSISQKDLEKSDYFLKNNIADRIARVADLAQLLNNSLKDSQINIYKYNNHANPYSSIKGQYLLKMNAYDNRTVYLVLEKHHSAENKFFGLSIFSRNLEKEKDFSIGHTFNTLLYATRTPLDINNKAISEKEEVLFKHSKYYSSSENNIKIVKFEPLIKQEGNVGVLTYPRPSVGQSLLGFIKKLKAHFNDFRKDKKASKALDERNFQISNSERDNELKENDKQQSLQITQNHKTLEYSTTKPTKSFSQGLDDFTKRVNAQNAQKPTVHNTFDRNSTKPKR